MAKRASRKQNAPGKPQSRRKWIAVSMVVALTLVVTGIFAQISLQKKKPAASQLSPASLTPTDPAKEYIYAGGRLVATEEPASGGCSYSINPTSQNFAASGGTGNVAVTASAGCAWTATSNAAWITITSGSSGNGNGTVNYSVASNSGAARNGTLSIAGQTFTVSQSSSGGGCTTGTGTGVKGDYFNNMTLTGSPTLTRTDPTVDFTWGAGSPAAGINVDQFSVRWTGQIEATCTETYTFYVFSDDGARLWVNNQLLLDRWFDQYGPETASSPISLTAGQRYDFKVEFYENGNGAEIHLKWSSASTTKQTIPQAQFYPPAGGGCSYSISPTSQNYGSSGGTGSVNVTTQTGCSWTATSNAAWITITSGSSGTGNGTVNYSVSANSGSSRSGTMTIAGQTFTVTQDAGGGGGSCTTLTTSPSSRTVTAPAQSGLTFTVGVLPSGCSWTAASNASWLTITGGSSGSGGGTVTYSVTQNTSGSQRTGVITVTGAAGVTATHTVKQNP